MSRILILAEGFSADSHYGKTMRGVLRYRREDVVAILDSTRAGETHDGLPVVGSVNDALCFNPTSALVGVATQGGRFPPAWRELLKRCIAQGLSIENGLHEFIADDPELADLARVHRVELRDLRRPPAGLSTPTGENMRHGAKVALTVGSECAIGKMTVSLELDRAARERGLASVFVPTGQTGIAIAGLGHLRRRGRVRLPGGRHRAARARGRRARRRAADRRGPGIDHPSGLLGRDARADPRLGAARLRAVPHGGHLGGRGVPGPPDPVRSGELVELHERISLPARKARVACVAVNTSPIAGDDEARETLRAAEAETGLPADDPVRFGADRLLDAVLAVD